jgi:CHASE3 domain sensor protein
MFRKFFFGTLIGCLLFGTSTLLAQSLRDPQDPHEKSRERIQMVTMLKLTEVLRLDRETAARFFALNGQFEETKRRLRWDLHQDIERLRQLTRDLNAPEKELRETVLRIKIKRKDLNDLSYKQLEDELNLLRPDQQARYVLFTIDFRREIDSIVREVRDERPTTARPAERWAPLSPRPPVETHRESYKDRTR